MSVYDVADFGIPQHRKRVIILGVNKTLNANDSDLCKKVLDEFYKEQMPKFKNSVTPRSDGKRKSQDIRLFLLFAVMLCLLLSVSILNDKIRNLPL